MEAYQGWEGSLLWKVEVTPGTPVTPDTEFGYVKSVGIQASAGLEEEGAVGIWTPALLEEGIIEAGFSCEFLPIDDVSLLVAKRNGSTGKLSSYSVFGTGGGAGIKFTGAKVNQLRGSVDAGGRMKVNMDWFALAPVDNAAIAAVVPTEPVFSWAECAHNLSGEVAGIEWSINQNLVRRAVIAGSGTTMPVSGQIRTPYRIREGRQSCRATLRFFERPSQNVIADVLAEIASFTVVATEDTTLDTLTWTFSNGKPASRNNDFSESGESLWPLEVIFKDWNVAYAVLP